MGNRDLNLNGILFIIQGHVISKLRKYEKLQKQKILRIMKILSMIHSFVYNGLFKKWWCTHEKK